MRPSLFKIIVFVAMAVGSMLGVLLVREALWNYRTTVDRGLSFRQRAEELFSGHGLDDFLPLSASPGEVFWFDYEESLWRMPQRVYGVRIGSTSSAISVNGVSRPSVRGFIASPGVDRDVDYCPTANRLIRYDPSNGILSDGDFVYLFHK